MNISLNNMLRLILLNYTVEPFIWLLTTETVLVFFYYRVHEVCIPLSEPAYDWQVFVTCNVIQPVVNHQHND